MPCVLFACAAAGTPEEQAATAVLIAKVFSEWEASQVRRRSAASPGAASVEVPRSGGEAADLVDGGFLEQVGAEKLCGSAGRCGPGQPPGCEGAGLFPESFGVFTPRSAAGAWWHSDGGGESLGENLPSVPRFPSWHEGDEASTECGDGASSRHEKGEPKGRLAEGLGEDQARRGGHGHAGRARDEVRLHQEVGGQSLRHALEEGPGGHGEVQQMMQSGGPDKVRLHPAVGGQAGRHAFVEGPGGLGEVQPVMQSGGPDKVRLHPAVGGQAGRHAFVEGPGGLGEVQQVIQSDGPDSDLGQHQRPLVQQQMGQPSMHLQPCPWRRQLCLEAAGADKLWLKAGRCAGKALQQGHEREQGGQEGREVCEGHGQVQQRLGCDGPGHGSIPLEVGLELKEPQRQLPPQHRLQQPLPTLQQQRPQLGLEPGHLQQQQGQPQPLQPPCPTWEQQTPELHSQQLCPVGASVAADNTLAALAAGCGQHLGDEALEDGASSQFDVAEMAALAARLAEFLAWWEAAKLATTTSGRDAVEAEFTSRLLAASGL
mmetsp:Transcript_106267/g.339230  ORF Transcript_106267/g.339230 Transcript_106267/m.339230 type:complete len:542 (-) Transcript_106267:155-1780(-)